MARRGYVQLVFQSTLPLRGATAYRFSIDETLIISIHTPLAGSDVAAQFGGRSPRHFNPHSPCGERRSFRAKDSICQNFNPHSPCGERLCRMIARVPNRIISIHTPLAGSDGIRRRPPRPSCHFNPHSPCGERPVYCLRSMRQSDFNPHSPCGERRIEPVDDQKTKYFNPHSPCGERRYCPALRSGYGFDFNPHSPCGERPQK